MARKHEHTYRLMSIPEGHGEETLWYDYCTTCFRSRQRKSRTEA